MQTANNLGPVQLAERVELMMLFGQLKYKSGIPSEVSVKMLYNIVYSRSFVQTTQNCKQQVIHIFCLLCLKLKTLDNFEKSLALLELQE